MELVALDLTAEYMSYNSEMQLFRVIKGSVLDGKIERSNYTGADENLPVTKKIYGSV